MEDKMNSTAFPTPYQDLNLVLAELVKSVRTILNRNFIGSYLQGSFAIGDYDEHSDVDYIIVVKDELATTEISELQVMHNHIYELGIEWAKHLEGSYFPLKILQGQPLGQKLWYLDNGSRSLIESDHCNSLVVRWTVREKGIVMAGPDPRTIINPIPSNSLRREIYSTICNWGKQIIANPKQFENRFYQSFIVLSYCRMLHDLQKGEISSKRKGAEWAKKNLDQSWVDLIDRTWAGRPNPAVSVREPADPNDFARTLKFIEYVTKESEAYVKTISL
jgi:Aminoglycoside adenylyltransferase, C-terminal domain/Nucleotidyltransferase domain